MNIAISNVAQASKETEASSSQTLQTASQLALLSKDLLKIIRVLKEQGVTVHFIDQNGDQFCTSGPIGDLIITILAAVAQLERAQIRQRIGNTMKQLREAGRQYAGVPYGKDAVDSGRKTSKDKPIMLLVDNPYEQDWIRWMEAKRHEGVSYNKIAQELTALFVPTKTGKGIWNQGIVFRILRTKTTEELLKAAA